MTFVWSVGTIIGPAVGGYFSDPEKTFPCYFSAHGTFARFPYLLPSLIYSALMALSMFAARILMDETHPDNQSHSGEVDILHRPSVSSKRPFIPAQSTSFSYRRSLHPSIRRRTSNMKATGPSIRSKNRMRRKIGTSKPMTPAGQERQLRW